MNHAQFLERLIASYPPALRPDNDYVRELNNAIRRIPATSEELEIAYDLVHENHRMFPTLTDINFCLSEAHGRLFKGVEPEQAFEYFRIDGIGYRRKLAISPSGEVSRLELPEGAYDYTLWVPYKYRVHEEALSMEEAIDQGYLNEGLYKAIKDNAEKSRAKSRFEKIGEVIREEAIDDSMFANPEPEIMDFGDI
jgi:hypothetical protein